MPSVKSVNGVDIIVFGETRMYCDVCGKITYHYITPNRSSRKKEDYLCKVCHVRKTYKVR